MPSFGFSFIGDIIVFVIPFFLGHLLQRRFLPGFSAYAFGILVAGFFCLCSQKVLYAFGTYEGKYATGIGCLYIALAVVGFWCQFSRMKRKRTQ